MTNEDQPAFDEKTFCDNYTGVEDLIPVIINEFLTHCPQMLKEINEAVANKDAKKLHISAHTLKGAVSNFRADLSQKLAAKLELQGKQNDLSQLDDTLESLNKEVQRLTESLAEFVKGIAA